jgi:myxalamid-type polyketide synthase MxaB
MQQANHVGKIVIVPAKYSDRTARAESAPTARFSGDASYLITGGLGGLGLRTALWMAERGAGCLVLMGRSAPSAEASAALDAMKKSGARAVVYQGDVANEKDVAAILSQIKESLPPLRGIIHSAAVLDDGSLLQQSWARFVKVMAPKARGAWLLSRLTQDLPLDFFVVYSSMASLVGSRGQSNYAAANAFLDGLCHYRRAHGQPATSIQWGPWSAVGAAAERDLNERLLAQGIHSIRPEEGLQVLDAILAREFTEVGVLAVDWPKYAEQFSGQEPPRFLTDLLHARPPVLRKSAAAAAERWQKIARAPLGERRRLLCDYAAAQALRVLGLDLSHAIKPDQPLHELGLDSLMAVELRNLLGSGLELKKNLPATLLFDYPTLDAVVDYLAREVLGWEKPASERAATDGEDITALADLEGLSDEDAEVLLLRELESDDHPRNG